MSEFLGCLEAALTSLCAWVLPCCAGLFCQLDKVERLGSGGGGGTSTEEVPPSDWLVDMPIGHFFN